GRGRLARWMEIQSVGRLSLETPHVASASTTASRSPETTTRAPASASHDSRPAVDVTALTTRDDFLLDLGQALGRQAVVQPVESLDGALRSMAGATTGPAAPVAAPAAPAACRRAPVPLGAVRRPTGAWGTAS